MVGVQEGTMTKELLVDLAVRYGFQVLGAVVILGVGAMVAGWLGRITDQRLQARAMEPPLRMLAVRALRLVVMLFAVVVALDKFGFQVAPLVAGIGVVGLGIGIALQGVLGNLVAGLSIILTKPFRVGEFIQIVGVHGEVAVIELFSTTLHHPDRSRIVIPNRKLVGEILHNYGTMRQLNLSVTVPHGTDLSAALTTVADLVQRNARVLKDPPAVIGIGQVLDGGVKLAIAPWVRVPDVGPADSELYQALVEQFATRSISFGTVPTNVRVLNGSARTA
jgi:small conductance mechanosensitive channel